MFTSDLDTIAAISTAPGEGAIGIVRLSGVEALAIGDQLYRQGDKVLSGQASHTIHYGHVVDPESKQVLDEVMVSVLKGPKTFTREDMLEINCHGGLVALKQVLALVLRSGARLAEPGEFTKRAFLNGRIDLTQAEAVMDVIRAKTDQSMQQAMKQLDGHLTTLVRGLRQKLLDTLAQVEVNVDYPEYDGVEEMTSRILWERTTAVEEELIQLLATAQTGKILREGLDTAIVGRPNVGKSSLLNALLREDKAIVTDIAGTTRDTIEEYVNVRGVPLKLIDTAGIRETADTVERIGVERSRQAIAQADLVFLLLNQSEALTPLDRELLDLTADKERLILLNKTDLPAAFTKADLAKEWPDEMMIALSMKDGSGLEVLEETLENRFLQGGLQQQEAAYLTNSRHVALLEEAKAALAEVKEGLALGMPVDLVQIDLTRAWEVLGKITGDSAPDELINELFSQFCLGK